MKFVAARSDTVNGLAVIVPLAITVQLVRGKAMFVLARSE
jgi:hypothetical protein